MRAPKRTNGDAGAVYLYLRVSTTLQAEHGVSLAEQQRQLDGRAREMGWTVTRTFIEEGVSGSVPLGQRPQGKQLLALLRPGDIVVATKLDRMFRSARDALNVIHDLRARRVACWLLDAGGNVSSNGIAQLMLTVLSAVAEFERHRTAERIREAKAHQRQGGRYLGGPVPFGWRRDNGGLVENPVEQAAIALMLDLHSEGKSGTAIAAAVFDQFGINLGRAVIWRIIRRVLAAAPQTPEEEA